MIYQLNKVKIQRGDDVNFFLIMLEENGQSFQTNGATLITLQLKKTDNTILEKTAYGGFGTGVGETTVVYGFILSAAETSQLAAGLDQDACIKIDFSTNVKHLVIKKALNVTDLQF